MAFLPHILEQQRKEDERRNHHNGLIADAAEAYKTAIDAWHAHSDDCGLCRLWEMGEDVTCYPGQERKDAALSAEQAMFNLIDQRK